MRATYHCLWSCFCGAPYYNASKPNLNIHRVKRSKLITTETLVQSVLFSGVNLLIRSLLHKCNRGRPVGGFISASSHANRRLLKQYSDVTKTAVDDGDNLIQVFVILFCLQTRVNFHSHLSPNYLLASSFPFTFFPFPLSLSAFARISWHRWIFTPNFFTVSLLNHNIHLSCCILY